MSLKRSQRLVLSMLLTLVGPVWALPGDTPPPGTAPAGILPRDWAYGLEGVPLDQWTNYLSQGSSGSLEGTALRTQLSKLLLTAPSEQLLFHSLKPLLTQLKLQKSEDYFNLAKMLLELRQDSRQRTDLTSQSRRDQLFLIQMLAEEVLYVGQAKFTDFPKEITVLGDVPTNGRHQKLRQLEVQNGDVVLSKATGSGSSSFIALSMAHPHIYSHSTPIYVDSALNVLSPEAEIEDGVKLRSMGPDYIDGSKTRMSVYRYAGSDAAIKEKIQTGTDNFVLGMYKRVKDPTTEAAYKYDFSMTPGEIETRGLFCSSVAYEIYKEAGITGSENPYAASTWSSVSKTRGILLKALNMSTSRVPAPGDLEINPQFRLVGMRIDISKLKQERVEMAILDVFLKLLDRNRTQLEQAAKSLEQLGNRPIDKLQIKAMAAQGALPPQLASQLSKLDKLPENINIKQLAFFAFLNEKMTPEIRTFLLAKVTEAEGQGKLMGPLLIRSIADSFEQKMAESISGFQQSLVKSMGLPTRCEAL